MGVYDLPAAIDFVRDQTKHEKITYVGHSQGTTQMFLAIALDEVFWKKRLNLFVATAPVIMPNKNSLIFKASVAIESFAQKRLAAAGIYELFG